MTTIILLPRAFSRALLYRSLGIHRRTGFGQARSKQRSSAALQNTLRIRRTFCAWVLERAGALVVWNSSATPKSRKRRNRSINPLLRIPSVAAVSLALAAPRQLSTLLFSVANKPIAVCAWLVLGAAVPWNLYRLKSDKRNLDWRTVCCFIVPFMLFSLLPCGKKAEDGDAGRPCIPIGDEFLTFSTPCEGEATLRRCPRVQSSVGKPLLFL